MRALLLALLALAPATHPALAAVRTVGPVSCQFTDLASAVAAASAGDVIRIHKDYNASTNVQINKSLTLVGGLGNCFATTPETPSSISELTSASPAPRQVLDIRGAGVLVTLFHLHLSGATSLGGLNIQDGAQVQAGGLEVSANSALFGGGIWLHGASILQTVAPPFGSALPALSVHDNSAPLGGGIFVGTGAKLESLAGASQISVSNNTAIDIGGNSSRGGGIYVQAGGAATGIQSMFSNLAQQGGAIYLEGRSAGSPVPGGVDLEVRGTLNLNNATDGGGVYVAASAEAVVEIDRLFQNHATGEGGGLWFGSDGMATVSVIEDNGSSGSGGGIAQFSGSLWIDQQLIDNAAHSDGGGLFATGGTRAFGGGIEIARNTSDTGSGGALYISDAGPTQIIGVEGSACDVATPCVIADNEAALFGGAIYLSNATLQVVSSGSPANFGLSVSGNQAGDSGGALFAAESTVRLNSFQQPLPGYASVWTNNTAGNSGGAITLSNSDAVVADALFGLPGNGNQAQSGGALHVSGTTSGALGVELRAINTRLRDNEASLRGGAISASGGARLQLLPIKCSAASLPTSYYCTEVSGNSAPAGAAIHTLGARVELTQTAVVGNVSDAGQAALDISGSGEASVFENVLIADNSGHGIRLDDQAAGTTGLLLTSATIAGNGSDGLLLADEVAVSVALDNSLIWDNGGSAIGGLGGSASASQLCSLFEGGALGAASSDPQFVSTSRGNYRLGAASAAINACLSGPDRDLEGILRDAMPDIGAFEFDGELQSIIFADGYESL